MTTTQERTRTGVALNADVVGYSRLMADDFAATNAAMDALRHLVIDEVAVGGGVLANFVGDNFMALFEDAEHAVRTAIRISRAIEEHNEEVPPSRRIVFRMGLDRGDVTVADGDYRGDALNIAARIQSMAPAGGVSVSGRVYRALDEPALRFRPRGQRRLKNIPEPVDVFDFADLPSGGPSRARRDDLALEIPSLAVLPIHADAVDDQVRSMAGIVRADLVHRLSTVPELHVVDAHDPMGDGGGGVATRYMVETGVYQAGTALRVFATIFDVTTMNVIKSHKWATTVDELLSLSEVMADEVARAVEVELIVGAPAGLYAELDDPEAIEKVYLGWYHMRSDTREGLDKALALFREVADSHPEQPYGWVLSAYALWIAGSNEWAPDPDAALQEARELAHKGDEIGDPTGMSRAVDAAILMSMGEIEAATEAMDNLDIIRPTCDVTFGLEGSLRRYMGQWEAAVDLLDVAMRLTGITKPWYPTVKACSLFMGDRVEQAAAVAEAVLEAHASNLEALLVLAAAQLRLGLDRRAQATVTAIRDRFTEADIEHWFARNPFQTPEVVDRWRRDLVELGLLETV